jgi:uncharacterized protein YggE
MRRLCRLCLALAVALGAGPSLADDAPPTITARGVGEIQVPADVARFNAAVVTTDKDANVALDENNRRLKVVLDALRAKGIDETEIETGRFSVHPVFTPRPPRVEPDWQPEIVGFMVRNQVQVRTRNLAALGDLITAATSSGANSIDNLTFDLRDPTPARAQAIEEATSNALADARTAADAANVKLGPIARIDVQAPNVRPLQEFSISAAQRAPVPVQPGLVGVQASVTVSVEIEP